MTVMQFLKHYKVEELHPVVFIIDGTKYNYYEVIGSNHLSAYNFNIYTIRGMIHQMTSDDLIKVTLKATVNPDDVEVVLPYGGVIYHTEIEFIK